MASWHICARLPGARTAAFHLSVVDSAGVHACKRSSGHKAQPCILRIAGVSLIAQAAPLLDISVAYMRGTVGKQSRLSRRMAAA